MPFSEHSKDHVSPLILWGHWFTFINMLLAMLVGSRYLFVHGMPETLLGQFYMAINLVGHSAFLAFAVYLFVLFPLTFALPFSHILRGVAAVIATAGLTLLAFDGEIYSHYRLHLNPFLLDIASTDITSLLDSTILAVVPVALLALQLVIANGLWKRLDKVRRKRMGNKVVALLLSCFVGSHLIHIWADATGYRPIVAQDKIFPLHYPATARTLIQEQGLMDGRELGVLQSSPGDSALLHYPLAPLQCHAERTPDVLMVLVEGWRSDMVSAETMPFLTKLAGQSHWFKRHSAASNQADIGLYNLLYGMLPNYQEPLALDQSAPVLTAQLLANGYQLNQFGLSINSSNLHWLSGIEQIASEGDAVTAERDINVVNSVIATIANHNQPQVNIVGLRAPADYSTPIGYQGMPTIRADFELNAAQLVLFNQYRQSLRFIDGQLQRLVAAAGDDTLLIITGNNGHRFSTDMRASDSNDFSIAATATPLLIRWPHQPAREINYQTSHYGLAPALMTQLLGCTNPSSDYSLGADLYQPNPRPYLVMGNSRAFAVQTDSATTVVDNRGDYRMFNHDYQRQSDANLDVQTLLQMMEEGGRFLAQ
ncbi:DUF3413 domain-containing protein [Ferrimonas senticii]|uniref:DUF3413 domain-containing protein n=1 Tax=Ferrimonas senticii TaxID=394566 RepID=UPI000415E1DA|nr:DUF3413 domain-containing protein [Ferrimonas senticii]